MNQKLYRKRHCVYTLNYHFVWIPRYRKAILGRTIADRMKLIFADIAEQYGFTILACEIMPDHIHLFVSAPPRFAPSEIVRLFKGISSRKIMQEFPNLRYQYAHRSLWAESYYVGTAGHTSTETIRQDIEENQGV